MAELFNIQLETDLSEFDSTVTDGGDLSQSASAGLAGTSGGMLCLIDDTNPMYGKISQAAPGTGKFRWRLYLDPNSLTMASGNNFNICTLYKADFTRVAMVRMKDGFNLTCFGYDDASGYTGGTYTSITDEAHYIELYLEQAATNVSVDGKLTMWIDGVQALALTGIDNYDTFADLSFIRIGAVDEIDTGTSGTFYIDEIRANDDGSEIGPVSMVVIPRRRREMIGAF